MLRHIAAALFVSSGASCIALVDAPIVAVPCDDTPEGACPEGLECGGFGATVERDGALMFLCVPEGCLQGASCGADCACACEGCAEDELCDVTHSESNARTDGKACVPAACFDVPTGMFECGTITNDGVQVTCLPCP